jgi:hypothetical protein
MSDETDVLPHTVAIGRRVATGLLILSVVVTAGLVILWLVLP